MYRNITFRLENDLLLNVMIEESSITLAAGRGHLSRVLLSAEVRQTRKRRLWGSVLIDDVRNNVEPKGDI